MLNHTINLDFGNKIYAIINMEAIPKFDIKSVIKSGIKFDISIKPTTWIGHKSVESSGFSLKKWVGFGWAITEIRYHFKME